MIFTSWRFVRSLGELHLLTRASYLMLIVVPILAGLWPAVRLAINHYNQSVLDATSELDATSKKLSNQIEKLDSDREQVGANPNDPLRRIVGHETIAVVRELKERAERYKKQHPP